MSPPLEKEAFIFKYCRMCAVQLKQGVFIFGDEGKRLQIPEKIRKTLTILVLEEDTLPKKICTSCCSSLEVYSQYKDTVLDAQEKLSAIAKSLERCHYEKPHNSSSEISLRPQQTSILQQALTSATIFIDNDKGSEDMDMMDEGNDDAEDYTEEVSPEAKAPSPPSKTKTTTMVDGCDEIEKQTVGRDSSSPTPPKSCSPVKNVNKEQSHGEGNNLDDDWVLQCGICSLPTESRADLKAHHEKSHSSEEYPQPVYGCSFCPRIGENYNALRMHIYRHMKEGSFKCDHCDRTFPLKNQLDKHASHYASNDGKNYNCKICGKQRFTAKCSLASHMKAKHNLHGKDPVEDMNAPGQGQEQEEMDDVHHSEPSSPPPRSSTPFGTDNNSQELQQGHEDSPQLVEKEEESKLKSPAKAAVPEKLEDNNDNGTSSTEKDRGIWKCEYCDKLYQTQRGLELHVGIHTMKKFECEHCEKTFTQKASLMHHLTSQHNNSPRLFKCDVCPKEFLTTKHLRRHKRFHTEPEVESQCSVCGKVYKSLLHLQSHMKLHKSKLNFPCATCGKRFQNKSKLSTHENSHTGARTFVCKHPNCSYAGRTPGPFYRHLKIHEKKDDTTKVKVPVSLPNSNAVTATTTNTTNVQVQIIPQTSSSSSIPKLDTENITLNFSSPILEDLSNKSPQKQQYHIVSVPRTPTTLVSIGQSHTSPIQQHSQTNGIILSSPTSSHLALEYHHSQQTDPVISHAHASSSHHPQNQNNLYHSSSSHQNWNNGNSSKIFPPTSSTTTFELVDCAFPCDNITSSHLQLPPPPSYQYPQASHAHNNNYSPPNQQNLHHAHTTATVLHTSPSSAHSATTSFISSSTIASQSGSSNGNNNNNNNNVTTIMTGGGHNTQHQHHQQNEPMELSYKLHLDNGQDVPMELTKVFQRDPLELCVRSDFNQLMDLSSRVNGDGMSINSMPLNLNNNCIGLGNNSYHKDLADRELCFNDLSGAFRQPIDLIARQDDPSHDICSEGNLVDLSLRSSFVQDQSTFLRELIDLSARSESFHGELNLTNKTSGGGSQQHQSSSSSHQQQHQSHSHHHHHPSSGKGNTNNNSGSGGGGGQGTLTAVIYQDAMFSL